MLFRSTVDIAAGGLRALVDRRPVGAQAPASLSVFGEILDVSGLLDTSRAKAARRPTRARR